MNHLNKFPENPMNHNTIVWVIEVSIWYQHLKELLTAFQKDYNNQTHLLHSQLEKESKTAFQIARHLQETVVVGIGDYKWVSLKKLVEGFTDE